MKEEGNWVKTISLNRCADNLHNFYHIYYLGNVSPVPMSGGSPPIPDKFKMKSTQAVNIAKKGNFRVFLCLSQSAFLSLFFCLSICLSAICLSLTLSLSFCLTLSVSSLSLSLFVSLYLSLSLSLCLVLVTCRDYK